MPPRVLIIADIEGSSGCWNRAGAAFLTPEWARACLEMTRDVNEVGRALLGAGVEHVRVKDFHRTAYNLLPERMDPRLDVCPGYRRGAVPGIGDPGDAEVVMMLGMHAAAGTGGFLAHTLTSRLRRLEVNGRPLTEAALFAGSLAPFGIRPVFFSGEPVACDQAVADIPGLAVWPIDKSAGREAFVADAWRADLAAAAVRALAGDGPAPYAPSGPFRCLATLRAGRHAARNLGRRWGWPVDGADIVIETGSIPELYYQLIRLCYLTPLSERVLPVSLFLYRLLGLYGRAWVRRRLARGEDGA